MLVVRQSAKALPPSTPKLFELASTCVHDFDEDNAEGEKQSQHAITTFEAIERNIKQMKDPCRSCMPTKAQNRANEAPQKKCNRYLGKTFHVKFFTLQHHWGRESQTLHHIESLTDSRDDEAANPAQKAGT